MSASNEPSIAERLAMVRDAIEECCRVAGRSAEEVSLLAVSKRKPTSSIIEAIEAGQRAFAENYLQEGEKKVAQLMAQSSSLPQADLSWHFIGHLQSNKAARAAAIFDVIQGLDSAKAAKRLAAVGLEREAPVRAYVQIQLAAGGARAGVVPEDAERFLLEVAALEGLVIEGVMAVAPAEGDPARHFARLRSCAENLRALKLPRAPLGEISAGMSGDFALAIREGATMVRLGTAIFGSRDT